MVPETKTKKRRPGRPQAIPPHLEQAVVDLYDGGLGYRLIAQELRNTYRLRVHFTTVKRLLVRLGRVKLQ